MESAKSSGQRGPAVLIGDEGGLPQERFGEELAQPRRRRTAGHLARQPQPD